MTLFARLETLKRVQGDIGRPICDVRDSEQEKIYVAMLLDFQSFQNDMVGVQSFRTSFGISNITVWSIRGDSNLVIFIPNICTNIFKLWIDTFYQVDFPLTMPIFQLFFSV